MKLYKHTCCVCKREFYSKCSHANLCSKDCRKIRDKQYREKARWKPVPQSENIKQYYEYCEKHGFITYGKYQAMKTAEALKQTKGG
jgi:hypothetical protein